MGPTEMGERRANEAARDARGTSERWATDADASDTRGYSLVQRVANRLYGLPPVGALRTRLKLWLNSGKPHRMLEIGPGRKRNPGFETVNIVGGLNTDYVLDARTLPFEDGSFDLVYASHVLEHIPWYQTDTTLKEWVRILTRGGKLQIWVPDGLKIAKAWVDFELHADNYIHEDGWYRFNPEKDPCKWAAGRIFTYGDGTGNPSDPNWHRALFSPRYLKLLLEKAGLTSVRLLDQSEVRGADHGWINLGAEGIKGPPQPPRPP